MTRDRCFLCPDITHQGAHHQKPQVTVLICSFLHCGLATRACYPRSSRAKRACAGFDSAPSGTPCHMPSETEATTLTEVLRQQHRNVAQMLSTFVPSKGPERSATFDCLRATLAVHETAEEMIVYPALRTISDDARTIADERVSEESEAKSVLADLERIGVDGQGFDELFERFRVSVLQHAEEEEQLVFPLLESSFDPDRLRQMASAVRVAEKLAPTHPHPHGPDSAVGNMLVGPFVGLVDKVRDVLSGHQPTRKAS